MKQVATIILNRNLPEITDKLYEQIKMYDGGITDIFVIESGSDNHLLSKYTNWHANWSEAIEKGLRFGGGMNYGLNEIYKSGDFFQYDAFFLLTNDIEFDDRPVVAPLLNILKNHPDIGIISPCGRDWGEKLLLNTQSIKYFWSINFNAYLIRRDFIEDIGTFGGLNGKNFLFDSSNFRGYGTEMEIAAKAYANNWSTAITSDVWMHENHSHLLNKSSLIKTEKYDDHLKLYIDEGIKWMRQKYGFKDHWNMQFYVKSLYDNFFEQNPSLKKYKL
jgi:hypothetical protein